jgi:type II secretory pathway pseudopilin PulG
MKKILQNSIWKKDGGMSLFEVLLAVAIFGIGIGTIAHLYLGSHYASLHSIEKNQALQYAKEGIEAVRSIRDGDISALMEIVSLGGVVIDKTTGAFSGYAWSDNVGWIHFAPDGPYPDSPDNSVDLNTSTGEVTGWATVLSDDEWILFEDVDIIDNDFYGWAWGDKTLGWVSFNCENESECATSDYKVWMVENDPEIDYNSTMGYAWSDNTGWINFPFVSEGDSASGVFIQDNKWTLTGSTSSEGKFTREILIEEIDDETWKVTSTVSWQPPKGNENSVSLSEYLTAWREVFLIEYSLNISAGTGGTITLPGEEGIYEYNYDEIVSIQAEPTEGYIFVNWTGDTGTIANTNSASTTVTINGNYTIVANFEEETP